MRVAAARYSDGWILTYRDGDTEIDFYQPDNLPKEADLFNVGHSFNYPVKPGEQLVPFREYAAGVWWKASRNI